MKRLLFLLLLAAPVRADLIHTISASTSLQVNAAATQAKRVGTSFSVSGHGVDLAIGDDAGRISSGTITSGVYSPGTVTATQNASSGESFSFSQTLNTGDAISGAAPSTGAIPNFSDITSTAAGVAGSAAATITSPQALTITAGGAGSVVVGQVVTTLQVD